MRKRTPQVEKRTSAEIAEQTRELLKRHLKSNWNEEEKGGEVGLALTEIFAHYCGLVIDRINRAPEKNFLAFLDLLGNSLVPPRPAQVPVTFFPHVKLEEGINIPLRTRIQAQPADDSSDPVIFETKRDLWVSVFELDGIQRLREAKPEKELSLIVNSPEPLDPEPVFKENVMYGMTFSLPDKKIPPIGQPITLFFNIDNPVYDPGKAPLNRDSVKPLAWEYALNNKDWLPLQVEDETHSLMQTGTVTFLVPDCFHSEMDKKYFFKIRIDLPSDGKPYESPPILQWVAINTVNAVQAVTIRDEVLGSSNGGPGQKFFTAKKPVLDVTKLQVMERPAKRIDLSSRRDVQDEWNEWEEVSDFYGSTALDRHFVLNHTTGEVRFGDGQNGMIPPPGTRNLRMKHYRAGGGSIGNVSVDSMKTLVAGAKGIDKIVNFAAATGGADAETYDVLLGRAPKALRHRGRAVTYSDYEDLARLASTEVARVLCVPLLDLSKEPYKIIENDVDELNGAGKISLIIVPHSDASMPLPSQILIQRIENYFIDKKAVTASLKAVGPLYLAVDIIIAIELESLRLATTIERQLNEKLTVFLHPLTGRDGKGWPFGKKPNKSDIYRLVKSIPGIKYTKKLDVKFRTDSGAGLTQIELTNRFLVCSGEHTISFK